jgi:hypothetical protein
MMDDLMFVAALEMLTVRVLTMIFGGMAVIAGFLLLWRGGAILVEKFTSTAPGGCETSAEASKSAAASR